MYMHSLTVDRKYFSFLSIIDFIFIKETWKEPVQVLIPPHLLLAVLSLPSSCFLLACWWALFSVGVLKDNLVTAVIF